MDRINLSSQDLRKIGQIIEAEGYENRPLADNTFPEITEFINNPHAKYINYQVRKFRVISLIRNEVFKRFLENYL